MPDKKSYPVIKTTENIDISYTEQGGNLSMKTQNLEVIMDKNSGKITFKDLQGNLLIQEKEFGTNFIPCKDGPHASYRVTQRFMLEPDETIFGLGQQQYLKIIFVGQVEPTRPRTDAT